MKLTKKLLIILILLIPKIGYAKTYLGEFNYNNDNNIDNKTFNNESIDKSNIVISKGKTKAPSIIRHELTHCQVPSGS